jgi:methionyl aminopeptidase
MTMTRRAFGQLFGWAATLCGCRAQSNAGSSSTDAGALATKSDPPDAGTAFDREVELVGNASRRVAAQSEQAILEESRRLAPLLGDILSVAGREVAPGVTTDELAKNMVRECRQRGLEPAMLGYNGYPAPAAVSVNAEIVHGIPTSRTLLDGDVVKVEFGVVSGTAFAAQSWTFVAGEVTGSDAILLGTGRKALRAAIDVVSPTSRLGDIGAAIQSTTEAAGLSVVRAFVGYGMGKQRIQAPQVSGFGRKGTGARLKPGWILNLHVIIKHGTPEVNIAANEWTAVAADGSRGALFTSMVEVTTAGHLELTRFIEP